MLHDDACLKCSLCITACPVVRVDPLFAGPKAYGPEWWRAHEARDAFDTDPHVDDCTFCQLCEAACPADVPVAHLIAQHKDHHRKRRPQLKRFRDFILSHPHWIGRLPFSPQKVPAVVAKMVQMSSHADFPVADRTKFHSGRPYGENIPTVGLFVDCFNRSYGGEVVAAAERVISRLGYQAVLMPSQPHCCGAAAYASGLVDEAQRIAQDSAHALRETPVETLLTLNATCDGTLRDEWPKYFSLSLPGTRVLPWTDWVLETATADFWSQFEETNEAVWVHTTCRGKVAQGEGAMEEFVKLANGQPLPLGIACCGAAGSYAFKVEHEDAAIQLGIKAKEAVHRQGHQAEAMIVDSGTCALHLAQYTGLFTMHPALWLGRRLMQAQSLDKKAEVSNLCE